MVLFCPFRLLPPLNNLVDFPFSSFSLFFLLFVRCDSPPTNRVLFPCEFRNDAVIIKNSLIGRR